MLEKDQHTARRHRGWNQFLLGIWVVLITLGIQNAGMLRSELSQSFVFAAAERAARLAGKQDRLAAKIVRATPKASRVVNRGLKAVAHAADQPAVKRWSAAHFEMSRNVLFEAGIESFEGKQAVACVTMNRVRSGQYPGSIRAVIWQRAQFSWTFLPKYARYRGATGEKNLREATKRLHGWRQAWADSQHAAARVMAGAYNCARYSGILYYMNPQAAAPGQVKLWLKAYTPKFRVGRHVFWVRRTRSTANADG